MKRVDINIRHLINLYVVNVLTVNALYADCCKNNEKKGKGCCGYGQIKDNDNINRDDDKKENDDDKKKKEEENKKKEEQLKQQKAELENKRKDIKDLLKEVIDYNNKLPQKDRIEIKTKDKDIDDCKDIESLNKISEELSDKKKQIFNKANEVGNKELAKQIFLNKKNTILNIFNDVKNLIKEINKIIDFPYISIKKEQIESEKNIENLSKFENDLNKQKEELSELLKDINDNSICKNEDDFIIKFNKRKNVLSYRFKDEMKNKLKSKDLTKAYIDDYFTMYNNMIKDTFTHKASLDLQIYRYILKLEGFIDALNNIFKKNIYYDFYTYYNTPISCRYWSKVYKKDNNYYLNIAPKSNEKDYKSKGYEKFRDIYSGIFRVDDDYFKYVRCQEGCTNGPDCISCKLRNFLNKEEIGEIYKKKYKEYGELTGNNSKLSSFVEKCFTDSPSYEKYLIPEKKTFMIEWALTIEFMKRFIKKLYDKDEFYLYRTLFLFTDSFKGIKKGQEIDGKNFCESNSIFGPCYYKKENRIYCFLSIKAEYYRCFCNHIINPFPELDEYVETHFEYFIGKLLGDNESEIVYIPKNQKYKVEEICHPNDDESVKNLLEYSIRKSLENFKINMKNDPSTKNSNLYSLNVDEIKEI